ncbi:activating signal cointegrator 1 complex subunit 3, partial [Tachysurus ichikawai]
MSAIHFTVLSEKTLKALKQEIESLNPKPSVLSVLSGEQALLTARRSPVLGRQREYERIHYPHVYDAYAEATKTSAFIGGSK